MSDKLDGLNVCLMNDSFPPVIDGVLANSEWKSVLFEAKSKSEAFDLNGAWGGEKDISLTGRVMYDSENLYLGLTVKDNAFVQEYGRGYMERRLCSACY